jgi:transposase
MSEELSIETERVDDLPVLLAQLDTMQVARLLDEHFPSHGNWQGVSVGITTAVWLSHILSQANHRLNHVQPWAQNRLATLQSCVDQPVRALDWSDDRLASILDKLSDDSRWAAFETALGQHLIRVYDLRPKQVRLDSTTASSYVQVTPDGLFQFGHSKDHRPDLPQLKVHLSALDPLGLPLSSTIVSGQRADDRLYVPEIQRVQQILGQRGLLYIGDCKMAALLTRAYIASSGDFYLCPLSNVQLPPAQLRVLLQAVWSGEQALSVIERTNAQGQTERIAEGFERSQTVTAQLGGEPVSWQERQLLVRSLRLAQQQEAGLRERLGKAQAQVLALNERKRGKQRLGTVEELSQAAQQIIERHRVAGLLDVHVSETVRERIVRGYAGGERRVRLEREISVQVVLEEAAVTQAIRELGWQVYVTNHAPTAVSLDEAVLAYRSEYLIERDFSRLKGMPLSLRPMYLASEDRVKGLLRLLMIGLRVLTLLECTVRQQLAAQQEPLVGLYAGQPKRATIHPTAEKLLSAFEGVTLTRMTPAGQVHAHMTPLSPLHQRILALLGFPRDLYSRVAVNSSKLALEMSEP